MATKTSENVYKDSIVTSVYGNLDYTKVETVTATTGGASTGLISATTEIVLGQSTNNAHFITLPTATAGRRVRIMMVTDTYSAIVQPLAASSYINGVACGSEVGTPGVGLLLATKNIGDFICVDATHWIAEVKTATKLLPA